MNYHHKQQNNHQFEELAALLLTINPSRSQLHLMRPFLLALFREDTTFYHKFALWLRLFNHTRLQQCRDVREEEMKAQQIQHMSTTPWGGQGDGGTLGSDVHLLFANSLGMKPALISLMHNCEGVRTQAQQVHIIHWITHQQTPPKPTTTSPSINNKTIPELLAQYTASPETCEYSDVHGLKYINCNNYHHFLWGMKTVAVNILSNKDAMNLLLTRSRKPPPGQDKKKNRTTKKTNCQPPTPHYLYNTIHSLSTARHNPPTTLLLSLRSQIFSTSI